MGLKRDEQRVLSHAIRNGEFVLGRNRGGGNFVTITEDQIEASYEKKVEQTENGFAFFYKMKCFFEQV